MKTAAALEIAWDRLELFFKLKFQVIIGFEYTFYTFEEKDIPMWKRRQYANLKKLKEIIERLKNHKSEFQALYDTIKAFIDQNSYHAEDRIKIIVPVVNKINGLAEKYGVSMLNFTPFEAIERLTAIAERLAQVNQ